MRTQQPDYLIEQYTQPSIEGKQMYWYKWDLVYNFTPNLSESSTIAIFKVYLK